MTFSANIDKAFPEITTLLSFRPRIRVTSWVNQNVVGQNVWSCSWTRGNVVGIYDRSFNTLEEEDTYAAMAADKGTWFFNETTETLYANFEDLPDPLLESSNPNFRVALVEWDVFFATKPLNWYRNPKDSGSDDQVWEAGLMKPPVPAQGNPDLLFGFSPLRVTNVDIAVADGQLLDLLHDWSINGSRLKVWECAGELAIANISEIFTGVAGSYSLQGGVLSIEVTDPLLLVQQAIEPKYISGDTFAGLDPQKDGAPLRRVIGCVEGFIGLNVDYGATPSTSNNRDWVVSQGQSNKAQITRAINTGAANTTDRTYLVGGVDGFRIGDSIIVEQGGTPTYGIFVLNVNYASGYIDHTTIIGRTVSSGDEVHRGFIGTIRWNNGEGAVWHLAYGRDWTETDFAQDSKGFVLANNFEANHSSGGAPAIFDPTQHTLYCTVYGDALAPKKLDGITNFCSLAKNGGALANPVGILWNILRDEIRTFREVVTLDEEAWFDLAQDMERTIGFALPEESTGSWGNWKEIVQQILQSELLRLHVEIKDGLSVLTITRDGPMGDADMDVSQEQLASPSWSWDYSDTYDEVAVEWGHREFDSTFYYGATQYRYTAVSNVARYLHRVSQTLDVKTLHYEGDHAAEVRDQLLAILSERRGVLAGVLPPSFIEKSIGQVVDYGSKFLPGAAVSGQINTRAMKLQRHAKSPAGVTVTLEDQKGIEDFTGDWEP